MRSYDVAVASLVIDAPRKWTDNVLSQHAVPAVVSQDRGVARRIPYSALLILAVTRKLHVGFGLGVAAALALAIDMVGGHANSSIIVGHFTLLLERTALEQELARRLADVLESAPQPRRGRPPSRQM